jgi:hypothetical protein
VQTTWRLKSRGTSAWTGGRQSCTTPTYSACRTYLDESGNELFWDPSRLVRRIIKGDSSFIPDTVRAWIASSATWIRIAYQEYICRTCADVLSLPPCWHCWCALVSILKSFSRMATGFPSWQIIFARFDPNHNVSAKRLLEFNRWSTNIWGFNANDLKFEHLFHPESIFNNLATFPFMRRKSSSCPDWHTQGQEHWDQESGTGERYLNWADSMAVSFGSIRTVLMFRALLACINALSCFLTDRSST